TGDGTRRSEAWRRRDGTPGMSGTAQALVGCSGSNWSGQREEACVERQGRSLHGVIRPSPVPAHGQSLPRRVASSPPQTFTSSGAAIRARPPQEPSLTALPVDVEPDATSFTSLGVPTAMVDALRAQRI